VGSRGSAPATTTSDAGFIPDAFPNPNTVGLTHAKPVSSADPDINQQHALRCDHERYPAAWHLLRHVPAQLKGQVIPEERGNGRALGIAFSLSRR
jgi:hypothetical protein